MTAIEKKIGNIKRGLELCVNPNAMRCSLCPYFGKDKCSNLLKDTIEYISYLEDKLKKKEKTNDK